jgi:hypothetical protein
VWSIWAVAAAAALWLVATFGRNVPLWDDWEMAPVLAGAQRVTPAWLWSQHNEHRIPLPRLLLLALDAVSSNDVRAGMAFNVLALAALAAVLLVAARRLRGSAAWSDAFFPLILLHWGHADNFLWGWQVGFVSSTALALAVLALLAVQGNRLTRSTLVGVGACLLLLPLCGANGLVLVPPLTLWLGWGIYHGWRSGQLRGRTDCLLAVGLLLGVLALSAAYLLGYERPKHHPPSAGVMASLRTALECSGMMFGLWGQRVGLAAGLATVGLCAAGAVLLVRAGWRQPAERPRALGLGLFLAGLLGLSLAVGWGRSGFGPDSGSMGRYVTLMTPALCGLYIIVGLYTRPPLTARVQGGLAVLAGLLLALNVSAGRTLAEGRCQMTEAFERDVSADLPPFMLVDRYSQFPRVLYPDPLRFARYLSLLRQAGVEPFGRLTGDPDIREVPLVEGQSASRRPGGRFVLGEPRFVYAVRVRYRFESGPAGHMVLKAYWRDAGREGLSRPPREGSVLLLPEPGEREVLFWVNGRVEQLWFQPTDEPDHFRIGEIVLLVPPAGEGPRRGPDPSGDF